MQRKNVLLIAAVAIALLGAGLVFTYVQGVKNQTLAGQSGQRVLVATSTIDAGETIDEAQSAGKIDVQKVPANEVVAGALSSTQSVTGEIALTTIYPKEQIVASKFGQPSERQSLTIPKGKMAISVQLTDPARVAGFVIPGSPVAVFASGTKTNTSGASLGNFTQLLLPSAEVIGVGQTTILSTTTTANSGQTTEQIPQTIVTLALDTHDAEKVLYAAQPPGVLALGLLTDKSDVKPTGGITSGNLFRASAP
jgi:pilus assembly protein CpaB